MSDRSAAGWPAVTRPGAGVPTFDVATVRALDAAAIAAGTPGIELMERAGADAFTVLKSRWPHARRIGVLAGAGNNGGDGYIVARLAADAGMRVQLCAVGDASRMSRDAAEARARWQAVESEHENVEDASALRGGDVIVDALFGIGLDRPPRTEAAAALSALNSLGRGERPGVLALDVPSGLNADTGSVPGAALRADATVTFIAAKRGLFTGRARELTGEVWLAPLVNASSVQWPAPDAVLDSAAAHMLALAPRHATSHKGSYGHVLLVGGDAGYGGAIRLAAEAAARAGAGLVSVATRPENVTALQVARPEVMARGVDSVEGLAPLAERATVLAIGPGLGTAAWGRDLLRACLTSERPVVLDADSLNLVARGDVALGPGTDPRAAAPRVLTPHPAEAARLLGSSVAAVEGDRFSAVQALGERFGATVVLKGAGTLVAAPPDGSGPAVTICLDGNPGMATGGMGDVLTGVIAALLAQGRSVLAAAGRTDEDEDHGLVPRLVRLGVAAHGAAADRAALSDGERGLLAMDVVGELRAVLNGHSR